MALRTNHFVDQAFWGSNWTVGQSLLASGSEPVWKSRLILLKTRLNVFNGFFGNCIISKELALKEPMDDVTLH